MLTPATLYTDSIKDLNGYTAYLLETAAEAAGRPIQFFFRADDIGIPSGNFSRMTGLFQTYELPLCLAIVPSWLTKNRLTALRNLIGKSNPLFCLHQHGWLHRNYEKQGKKQEFGPARKKSEIKASLEAGRNRLQNLLEEDFSPCFTPPWNRCSLEALESLNELHFKVVSGSSGTPFPPVPPLQNIPINIDLHTGKEHNQESAFCALTRQFQQAGAAGQLGIMLHHQRMNAHAFDFLEALLKQIARSSQFNGVHFDHMVP